MKVTPKTEEELAAEGSGPIELLRDGVYDFEVALAEERTSNKTGQEMIELQLRVFGPNGQAKKVYDYLIEGAMSYKVKHFAEAVGLTRAYEAGELSAYDCEGKQGRAKIGREPARDGYQAKNRVIDYEVATAAARPAQAAARAPARSAAQPARRHSPSDIDDEIPF
jgi:hypothetical protein